MKVHQIINTFHSSNTYIIYNDLEIAYIIDCGDAHQVIKWFSNNHKILSKVFLTHTHYDHIYGLNDLLVEFKNLQILTSAFGKEALYNTKKNLSHYHEKDFKYKGNHIIILENNDTFLLWDDIKLQVYETIGHDKSCLTYSIGNYLFTGDSYIPGIKVTTSLPNANKEDAKISTHLIRSKIIENTIICPGHGKISKRM